MLIKLDLSSLRETRWSEYALRFAFGGVITVAAGLIAEKWGPSVGGLFLAFPAIFPATVTLTEKHETEKKEAKGMTGYQRGRDAAALEAVGSALGAIGLLVFGAIVWILLPRYSPYLVISSATIAWAIVSAAGWALRREL